MKSSRCGGRWFALFLVVLGFSGMAAVRAEETIRVNCGGKKAEEWSRDKGYLSGMALKTASTIAKVKYAPQAVYQTCRFDSNLGYSFPALSNGVYTVRLHFAELFYTAPGARVFDVRIEGVKAVSKLDVFARAGGKNRALRLSFRVVVEDGNGLQIQLVHKKGGSCFISGIEIIPVLPPDDLVLIPSGSNSGSNPLGDGESHTPAYPEFYNLAVKTYYISAAEVTQAQWEEVAGWGLTNGYTDLPAGGGKAPDHPVQTVNWYDCVKWCNARSQMERRTPAYYTNTARTAVCKTGTGFDMPSNCVNWASGYRLPTVREWEYAARGGLADQRFPWGAVITHGEANYFSTDTFLSDQSTSRGYHPSFSTNGPPNTSPVGAFAPNGFGLYDVAGNVDEWCWDWHPNGVGSQRTARGGNWDFNSLYCRVGYLPYFTPDSRFESTGFRVVLPALP